MRVLVLQSHKAHVTDNKVCFMHMHSGSWFSLNSKSISFTHALVSGAVLLSLSLVWGEHLFTGQIDVSKPSIGEMNQSATFKSNSAKTTTSQRKLCAIAFVPIRALSVNEVKLLWQVFAKTLSNRFQYQLNQVTNKKIKIDTTLIVRVLISICLFGELFIFLWLS